MNTRHCVYLSVCLHGYLHNYTTDLHQIFVTVYSLQRRPQVTKPLLDNWLRPFLDEVGREDQTSPSATGAWA